MKEFSAIFKDIRRFNKYSQEEFAKKLAVSRSAVAQVEASKNNPSRNVVLSILESVEVPNDIKNYLEDYVGVKVGANVELTNKTDNNNEFESKFGYLNIHSNKDTAQIKLNRTFSNVENLDIDYTSYYLQNIEYERMQKWLFNIVQLLVTEFNREINKNERLELSTCLTNTYSTSYIKQNGEAKFKNFIDEHVNLTKELIDKYLDEYYKLKLELNPQIDNFDFM